jgi:hypothetical protein
VKPLARWPAAGGAIIHLPGSALGLLPTRCRMIRYGAPLRYERFG